MARFEDTGRVDARTSPGSSGWSGVAGARLRPASATSARPIPAGIFRFAHIPVSTWTSGDVFARAYVRWLEIERSVAFMRDAAPRAARRAPSRPTPRPLRARTASAVSLVEGWRGEICHVALTDERGPLRRLQGRRSRRSTTGPGLAMALRDQQISDFPLCNKSFNLSYCGHDL